MSTTPPFPHYHPLEQGSHSKLRLLVVLDLTHDLPAVEEAYARNVMTVSLVNAHSDLSRITYPVYAGVISVGNNVVALYGDEAIQPLTPGNDSYSL